MGKIRKLDAQTANMIAAGEVVERPMGVIKELIENAIDAESTRIDILIEEGGMKKLTVRDNGTGMDSEDARLAFERHATSKIKNQNDLWSISTMGFRGEALPSIASVSKLTMITGDGEDATKIVTEYGEIMSVSNYPCDQGTEITVEGLFYRTPARLKHMKSGAYEASLIQDVIMKFALSRPDIAFHFYNNGREAFRTTGQSDLLEVIYTVFGRSAAENALPVEFSDFDYRVSGYLVRPSVNRASRSMMHLFLNSRMVRTYSLYKAVQEAYSAYLPDGRYPMCVLNIEMDPHLLDVNVHPSKWEVRLSKEKQLEYLLQDEVRKALREGMPVPQPSVKEAAFTYYEPMSFDIDSLPEEKQPEEKKEGKKEPVRKEAVPAESRPPVTEKSAAVFPEMRVIGQYRDSYILCAVPAGLAVVDQHTASACIFFEKVRTQLNESPLMSDLLIPVTLHCPDDLVQRCDEVNAAAADLNIVFEPFGHDTLLVRSVPVWMKDTDMESLLKDILDLFRDEKNIRFEKLAKDSIARTAARYALSKKNLTTDEMNALIRDLAKLENPFVSPSGKPVFIILNERDLLKEFRR
ncbi:MAG: DNA mismatch repair endonuclease MutL [Solobacterium sp.]|nr:DNA mismatch repair endonuclease MutL [Solobacterium sp.]